MEVQQHPAKSTWAVYDYLGIHETPATQSECIEARVLCCITSLNNCDHCSDGNQNSSYANVEDEGTGTAINIYYAYTKGLVIFPLLIHLQTWMQPTCMFQ